MGKMFGTRLRVRTKLWLRASALLVLLAWMPSVLAVDHWSTPGSVTGDNAPRMIHLHGGSLEGGDPHVHRSVRQLPAAPETGSAADAAEHAHAEHGHGAAGGSVVGPIALPAPVLVVQLSVLTTALDQPDAAPMRAAIAPPTPPPPQAA